MKHGSESRAAASASRWQVVLVLLMLGLAAVQVVRADFFVNHAPFPWSRYVAGGAPQPFQSRIGMWPLLHWAHGSHAMQVAAARYDRMVSASSPLLERTEPEKLVSLLAGIAALWVMIATGTWIGVRRVRAMWWLTPALILMIAAVTLDVRVERNAWYPYDLPHAALFGLAVVLGLERCWTAAFACFAADVLLRETSIFLVPVLVGLWLVSRRSSDDKLFDGRKLTAVEAGKALLIAAAMLAWWMLEHKLALRYFPGHGSELGLELGMNLHEVVRPQHWPQMLSAGGYLVPFVWLARRRLPLDERTVMYVALLCAPVVLYFGLWAETRIWLEWTVPLGVLAAQQLAVYAAEPTRAGATIVRA